jgi:cytochrome P450
MNDDYPDLSDPRLYAADGIEHTWARLRVTRPVHWVDRPERGGYWSVLSYAVANRILKDPAAFPSAGGMRLDAPPASVAAAAGKMLIVTDPPRHGAIRRLISSAFTPRMVARLETTMRATCIEIIEAALERGNVDLTEVAARLPVAVICDMLGVPSEDWDLMLALTSAAFGDHGADTAAVARAHTEMLVYYDELVALRRRSPGEDIVSALVHGEVDGARLSDEEVFLNCDGLVSGGNETTRHATTGGVLALSQHRDQWRRLADDLSLIPAAVPEILRYTSPALHVLRTAAETTELAGAVIEKGQPVAVWLAAANRDGEVFAEPDRFDTGRCARRHLAFGTGAHFCLGSALATKELEVFFTEFLSRVADVEPDGPSARLESTLIRGFHYVPIRLTRAD